jgi:DNA-binding transcriptional LysR family regulator
MMTTPVTLRQLEIFLAVAQAGHVTRASASLHLSQSAASMAISELERLLETRLFDRTGRTLALTERGRLLMREARVILARVAALPSVLGGEGTALRGELRIAASQTIGRYLLAVRLADFNQRHPMAGLNCRIASTSGAIDLLMAHEVDVAYVEGSVPQPSLDARPWRRDRLEIVVAFEPRWRGSLKLTPTRLRTLRWIMREPGSGTRELFDHAVRNAGLEPLAAVQTLDDTEAIKQAVIAGQGAACLPYLAIQEGLKARKIRRLEAPFLSLDRQLWRVIRRDSFESPLQRALDACLDGLGRPGGQQH